MPGAEGVSEPEPGAGWLELDVGTSEPWLDMSGGEVGLSCASFEWEWDVVDVVGFDGVTGLTGSEMTIVESFVVGGMIAAGALGLGAVATSLKASMPFCSATIISLDRVSPIVRVSRTVLAMIALEKAVAETF